MAKASKTPESKIDRTTPILTTPGARSKRMPDGAIETRMVQVHWTCERKSSKVDGITVLDDVVLRILKGGVTGYEQWYLEALDVEWDELSAFVACEGDALFDELKIDAIWMSFLVVWAGEWRDQLAETPASEESLDRDRLEKVMAKKKSRKYEALAKMTAEVSVVAKKCGPKGKPGKEVRLIVQSNAGSSVILIADKGQRYIVDALVLRRAILVCTFPEHVVSE